MSVDCTWQGETCKHNLCQLAEWVSGWWAFGKHDHLGPRQGLAVFHYFLSFLGSAAQIILSRALSWIAECHRPTPCAVNPE